MNYFSLIILSCCVQSSVLFTTRYRRSRGHSSILFSQDPHADEICGWGDDCEKWFLEKYWQRKPVLIRSAVALNEKLNINKFDLMSLAIEDDVESRLMVRRGQRISKEYGPFDYNAFESLPQKNWTILVQEVDRHIPQIADMWQRLFNFIPGWRRDDIMISYAACEGGIGGHVDNYDVFLLQGSGRREWSIENSFLSKEDEKQRAVPRVDTKLLKDFRADQTWELETGDMLYLPPRVPHRGVSLSDDCMTVSFGFRAPTYRSMLTALTDHVCRTAIPEDLYYSDPSLQSQRSSPGLIDVSARDAVASKLREQVLRVLDNPENLDAWLGEYLSTPLRMQVRNHKPFFLASSSKALLGPASDVALGDEQMSSDSTEDTNNENTSPDGIWGANSSYGSDEDSDYGNKYDSDYEDEEEIPISVTGQWRRASSRMFSSAAEVVRAFEGGEIALRRGEGIQAVYTASNQLFVNGVRCEVPRDAACEWIPALIGDNRELRRELLTVVPSTGKVTFLTILENLIGSGTFYPIDL